MPSGCPGQVDFPAGHAQVTFHSHLPNGQGPRKVICQLNRKKSNLRLVQGKQNLRATSPKGKLEFKFFPAMKNAWQKNEKTKQMAGLRSWRDVGPKGENWTNEKRNREGNGERSFEFFRSSRRS